MPQHEVVWPTLASLSAGMDLNSLPTSTEQVDNPPYQEHPADTFVAPVSVQVEVAMEAEIPSVAMDSEPADTEVLQETQDASSSRSDTGSDHAMDIDEEGCLQTSSSSSSSLMEVDEEISSAAQKIPQLEKEWKEGVPYKFVNMVSSAPTIPKTSKF